VRKTSVLIEKTTQRRHETDQRALHAERSKRPAFLLVSGRWVVLGDRFFRLGS
jgi:hypothetical protein